jgi:hypothetical protein
MNEPRFAEEQKKMAAEPILPVERKLVAWSVGIGLALLVVLVWVVRG